MLNYRNSSLIRFIARRRPLPTETAGNIDQFAFIDGEVGLIQHGSESDVQRGAPLYVRGWAIDLGRRRAPWELRVAVDGQEAPARLLTGLERIDVARRFSSPDLVGSGFVGLVETKRLAIGPHKLNVRAIVGRLGTSFAQIPVTLNFHVLDFLGRALSPPPHLATTPGISVDTIPLVRVSDVLVLNGKALDGNGQPFETVAAQIDDGVWNLGWLSAKSDWSVRIRLDALAVGIHSVTVAGKTRHGEWMQIDLPRQFTVAYETSDHGSLFRRLIDGGDALIVSGDGKRCTHLELYRTREAITISGVLRRSSPIGLPIELIARSSDCDTAIIAGWSTPTTDPHHASFGAKIPERALRPGNYQLFVKAPDRSMRFMGYTDTGCELTVKRRPTSRYAQDS